MRSRTSQTKTTRAWAYGASLLAAGALVLGPSAVALGAGAATAGSAAHSHSDTHVVAAGKVAFKGSYTGTIALLWNANSVTVSSVKGSGTATTLGTSTMSGSGNGQTASTCDPFGGTGTLTGSGSSLHLTVVSSSSQKACAAGDAAPTTVSVTGVAKVTGGSGKFAGASGTLNFKGSFAIQSSTSGTSESDAFSATITGTLSVK